MPKSQQAMVSALVRQVLVSADVVRAHRAWRRVADALRDKISSTVAILDEAEHDVPAHQAFPAAHRVKIHLTNTLEWLSKEMKRRANVAASSG